MKYQRNAELWHVRPPLHNTLFLVFIQVIGDENFLNTAHDIYSWIWKNGWDYSGTCGGGFWFDQVHWNITECIKNSSVIILVLNLLKIDSLDIYTYCFKITNIHMTSLTEYIYIVHM